MDYRAAVWLAAMLLAVLAPLALLADVVPWRVAAVTVWALVMGTWAARWLRR